MVGKLVTALRAPFTPPSASLKAVAPVSSAAPAPTTYQAAKPLTGFYHHVRSAMASNHGRKDYYARASQGASKPLSNELLSLEAMVLPIAATFDHLAGRLNRQGVGVVADDFAPMENLPPADRAPRYTRQATPEQWSELSLWLETYRREAGEATRNRDFARVARVSDALATRIESLEATSQSNFAMTRHLVESVGFAAAHGVAYRSASQGASDELVSRFLLVQAMGLSAAISLDRQAQPLQAKGLGILVNDLPAIPLHQAVAHLGA